MNTKYLMIGSALFLGFLGVATSFFPEEIAGKIGLSGAFPTAALLQLIGALYLGFGIMNWMAKTVLIGGIYARPLAMGNFMHFLVGGLALAKVASTHSGTIYIWIAALLYAVFALAFGMVAFGTPYKKAQ